MNRIDRFQHDRFGISFHWGLYSIGARSEWVQSIERQTPEEYDRYFESFSPDLYDPREWAEIVKASGAKYAVLTAKHHDGFCLWDTSTTSFKATNTPAKRDLIREYVDAMRSAGIGVGLYYSLVDWSHPDYPHFGDRQHPMRFSEAWRGKEHHWDRYIDYMHRQIKELLTGYGELNQLVLDFPYWDFTGEHWGALEIVKMVREFQPNCIFNDRLGGNIKGTPLPWVGDYDSPELNVPREAPVNDAGIKIPFETWITLTNCWCWSSLDQNRKLPKDIVRTLVNCVSKGGNLLLNVGPNARGQIDGRCSAVLRDVGEWLSVNGDSIYGCGDAGLPKPEWGRWTRNGDRLYAHILEQPVGHINLPELKCRVKNPRLLATGSETFLCEFWNYPVQTLDSEVDQFLAIALPSQGTWPLPDPVDTVVQLDLNSVEEQILARTAHEERLAKLRERTPFV